MSRGATKPRSVHKPSYVEFIKLTESKEELKNLLVGGIPAGYRGLTTGDISNLSRLIKTYGRLYLNNKTNKSLYL